MTDSEILAEALLIPSGYAEIKLGLKLHPTQKAVLDNIFKCHGTRTAFRCANGVGKTSIVATVSILYALDILNAQVVSTAATYRQVIQQLIPNLKSHAHLYPNWEFLDNAISINGIKKYLGFSTQDESTFQGYHEKPGQPLLIITDESAGINESIFRAIDRCNPTYLLILGSPLAPEGEFYKIEYDPNKSKYYDHFKLTAPECDWIKKVDIDRMVDSWGNDHPLVLSSIYAEFAGESEGSLISLASYENCLLNAPEPEVLAESPRCLGIDVAAGGDENVLCLRHGNMLSFIKCWRDRDTMSACGAIVNELNRLKMEIGLRASEVVLDVDGLGTVVADRLRELKWPVVRLHNNSEPLNEDYKNRITELWVEGCKKIRNRQIILPDDQELKMQILSRKQKLHSTGKIMLETKEDMKERGINSPDRADAFFMAMSEPAGGTVRVAIPVQLGGSRISMS